MGTAGGDCKEDMDGLLLKLQATKAACEQRRATSESEDITQDVLTGMLMLAGTGCASTYQ
jgi:hypothetical protein